MYKNLIKNQNIEINIDHLYTVLYPLCKEYIKFNCGQFKHKSGIKNIIHTYKLLYSIYDFPKFKYDLIYEQNKKDYIINLYDIHESEIILHKKYEYLVCCYDQNEYIPNENNNLIDISQNLKTTFSKIIIKTQVNIKIKNNISARYILKAITYVLNKQYHNILFDHSVNKCYDFNLTNREIVEINNFELSNIDKMLLFYDINDDKL